MHDKAKTTHQEPRLGEVEPTHEDRKVLPVINPTPNNDPVLLSCCAILRWFDHDLLIELVGCDQQQIATLLASDLVEAATEPPNTYRLRESFSADVLARMRAERPIDEL